MNQLFNALQRYGIGRLAVMLGIGAGAAALIAAIVLNLGAQPMGLLYSNLDLREAGTITQALEQAGIKYEVKGDGSTIMVARDKVASARLMLAGKGLPTASSVGYEIFDQQNALGQTDLVQQLNMRRALEGELARTIKSLDGVTEARVHLVMPRRQLFEDEAEQPTAAVTIGVGAREPSADQVRSVQNLVAGSGAEPESARQGHGDRPARARRCRPAATRRLGLGPGPGSEESTIRGAHPQDRSKDIGRSGRRRRPCPRPGHRRRRHEPGHHPGRQVRPRRPGGALRTDRRRELARTAADPGRLRRGRHGQHSRRRAARPPAGGAAGGNTSERTDSTTNYEISHTTTTEVHAPGTVKRLSVAVAVDGVSTPGPKGKPAAYAPRTADEMKRLDDLVKAAIGFSTERGDTVSVVNVRFPHDEDADGVTLANNPLSGFDKNDIMRAVELAILGLVSIMILFFVIRPLVRGAASGGGGMPALAGGGRRRRRDPRMTTNAEGRGSHGARTHRLAWPGLSPDIDQQDRHRQDRGPGETSSVKRVSEFVDMHPDESVSILRTWLHETCHDDRRAKPKAIVDARLA